MHRIIELIVNNHPGVMSHVTGLFSRRGFNLEAIVCAPIDGVGESRIYLLVKSNGRLEQILRQLGKLYDVREVNVRGGYDEAVFARLHEFMATCAWRSQGTGVR